MSMQDNEYIRLSSKELTDDLIKDLLLPDKLDTKADLRDDIVDFYREVAKETGTIVVEVEKTY